MFDLVDPPDDEWDAFVLPVPPPDGEADPGDGNDHEGCLDAALQVFAAQAMDEAEKAWAAERLSELDADETLAEVASCRAKVNLALAEQLVLATHWADLHGVLDRPVARPGAERLVQVGGDGTPEIAEFAPVELGAVLRVGDNPAVAFIADGLDLRHRFPLLWALVRSGSADVWMARKTVQLARPLSKEAAAKVDQQVAGLVGTLTWRRLRKVVEAAILRADPPKALDDAERAAAEAGVWLNEDTKHGYGSMFIRAAAGDLKSLKEALDIIAQGLKVLGDPRTADQRRAAAIGFIANPQAALDLSARAEQARTLQNDAAAARRAGEIALAERIERSLAELMLPDPTSPIQEAPSPNARRCDRRPLKFGTSILYYHLSREALDAILAGQPFAGAGVGRVEDIGPIILDQVRQWLQHSHVILKPVIDLAGTLPVDHYEVPQRLSEVIGLRRQADYSPYGDSLSRHQENEHTIPYVPMNRGGPPGQTDPAKMAKISKFRHRVKTFAGWTVHQLGPQHWWWRTPYGYNFLVGPHGTTALGKL